MASPSSSTTIDRGYNVPYITLGCAKNEVGQIVCAPSFSLWRVKLHPDSADIAIINTCSFWLQHQSESIETTLEIAGRRFRGSASAHIMCGCVLPDMAQSLTSSFLKLLRLFQIKKMAHQRCRRRSNILSLTQQLLLPMITAAQPLMAPVHL